MSDSDYRANVMSINTFFSFNPKNKSQGYDIKLMIPELQRSFVWDARKDVKGFWQDMQEHRLASEADHPRIREMFGGTIVLHTSKHSDLGSKLPHKPKITQMADDDIESLARSIHAVNSNLQYNKKRFIKAIEQSKKASEVIDGQQRLTVLMIGAKVLEEIGKVKSCQANLQTNLKNVYLKLNQPRLTHLGVNEVRDFKNILQNHTGTNELLTGWSGEESLIREAYRETLRFFSSKEEGIIKGRWLKRTWKRFVKFMLFNTSIVVLETTEFHQSHLVFRSLNWKGRKLQTSELFKSVLFHFSALNESPVNQTRVKSIWENIVKNCNQADSPGDSVSNFLRDWCKSVGKKRNHAAPFDPKDSEKEILDSQVLDILEMILRNECPRGQSNTGRVLRFVENLEKESRNYNSIWNPTQANCSGLTGQWMSIIDLRRIFSQGGLTPILLYILRQDGIVGENSADAAKLRNDAIRCLVLCTVYAVIPDQSKVNKDSENPSKFAALTRTWISDLHSESSSIKRLERIKKLARIYLERENLYPEAEGKKKKKWIVSVNKKWCQIMLVTGIKQPTHAKLLLRLIETIDCIDSSPLNYTSMYDKNRLQAEHIFPKSVFKTMATRRKSEWQKEWELDNSIWPENDDERNALKFLLGNYTLLEKEINNRCNTRTWKGWPKPTKPPSTKIPKTKGKNSGRQNFKGLGKIHYYKSLEWKDTNLTGPLVGGSNHKGSHLKSVESLIKYAQSMNYWGQTQIKNRTKSLLNRAINDTKCLDIDLNYLY